MTIDSPRPYEANAGVIAVHVPAGTDRVRVLADGRSVRSLPVRRGRRVLVTEPLGLPSRDLTVRVEAYRGSRLLAARSVGNVFGLPRLALAVAPARRLDPALQRVVRSLRARTGVAASAWLRDLRSGAAAASNAGARFPSASTLKLGILLALLARTRDDPVSAPTWSRLRSMIGSSSNRAANELLPLAGGASAVNALMAAAGATATDLCCPYLLEPDERSLSLRPAGRPRAAIPPVDVTEQPTFPCCKYTTAHDLGTVLVSLALATSGHGPLTRNGLSAREARVAVYLLIHTDYPGLVRPAVPFVVAHKAGWLPQMQHDAALVFSPRGTIVTALMTYSPAGVSYPRAAAATAAIMRVALAEQRR